MSLEALPAGTFLSLKEGIHLIAFLFVNNNNNKTFDGVRVAHHFTFLWVFFLCPVSCVSSGASFSGLSLRVSLAFT